MSKLEEGVAFFREYGLESDFGSKAKRVIQQDLMKQGLIQSFEFTHELAWNVMKDYASFQGNPDISGSRDAARTGFSMGLIQNGDIWIEMIFSRNKSSHTYDEETAEQIVSKIIGDYLQEFRSFKEKMQEIITGNQGMKK